LGAHAVGGGAELAGVPRSGRARAGPIATTVTVGLTMRASVTESNPAWR
jgi:hypothetical protein